VQSLLKQKPDTAEASDLSYAQGGASVPHLPSYQPTPLAFVNRLLDLVDTITHGRAGWVQRFFVFAFIGGCAALVNMIVFYIVYDVIALPVHEALHNVIAEVCAAELSILANFIPNDYFTFRRLPGHSRSWLARCLRFHTVSVGGSVLTFLIEFSISHLTPIRPIIAQAIALILVLFYNFTFHHLFTYRHMKPASATGEV
jgi:putative flippase GtrA